MIDPNDPPAYVAADWSDGQVTVTPRPLVLRYVALYGTAPKNLPAWRPATQEEIQHYLARST